MKSIRPSTNPPPTLRSALAEVSPHSLAGWVNRCSLPCGHVAFVPGLPLKVLHFFLSPSHLRILWIFSPIQYP